MTIKQDVDEAAGKEAMHEAMHCESSHTYTAVENSFANGAYWMKGRLAEEFDVIMGTTTDNVKRIRLLENVLKAQ